MKELSTLLTDNDGMHNLGKLADFMSQSRHMIPLHLQKNKADCFAICLLATRLNTDPFALAQKTYMIKGRIGYEAQLVNALVMNCGAITGTFKYEYGKGWENNKHGLIRVGARLKGEDDITWGEWLDCSKVTVKNSPLWKTQPKQQAAYLAVRMWSRLYVPSAILGMYTADELQAEPEQPKEKEVAAFVVNDDPEPEVETEVAEFFEDEAE